MLFSSVTFLFYFLPLVIIVYYICPTKYKNYILLLASLIFYSWGGILYLPLLLISITVNFIFGLKIDKYRETKIQKNILILSIIFNVLFLGVFKYSNFLVDNMNSLFSLSINIVKIPLPIGISFYTFQAMSYVIDVYRKDGKVQKKLSDLALYISMFPQLVAGPIVRYQTVDNQINNRSHSIEKFNYGIERLIIGLFKKVIISNTIGELATLIYGIANWKMTISTAWIGAIAYTLQIYFDFSGYSDMAVGLGKIFGFDFDENFNYPYISRSVGEFWRRWHISLGTWFKDYVYIPLGGNRGSNIKTYRNLAIVWIVTGIWHGASWNFVVWGVYFGIFIMMERAFLNKILNKSPKIMQHMYLLLIVVVGWVIFSQPSLESAIEYIKIMFGFGEYPLINGYTNFYINEYWRAILMSIILSTPVLKNLNKNKLTSNIIFIIRPIVLIGSFALVIIYLINSTFNPFIYFNF